MLFPGIKKLAAALMLKDNKTMAFGEYRSFFIYACDGQNFKKVIFEVALSDEELEGIQSILAKFRLKRFARDETSFSLSIPEYVKPYSVKKMLAVVDAVVDFLSERKKEKPIACSQCGRAEYSIYSIRGSPIRLCDGCHARAMQDIDNQDRAERATDVFYLAPALAGLLWSLPGFALQAVCFIFLNRIAAVSYVLYFYLFLAGYLKARGPKNLPSVFIISLSSLAMTLAGTVVSFFGYSWELMATKPELRAECLKNVGLTMLVSVVIFAIYVLQYAKTWGKKYNALEKV